MFKTRADGCSEDNEYLDEDTGAGIEGTALMAADRNCIQRELMNAVEDAGFTESLTDFRQIGRMIIALSKKVGEFIYADNELTPVPLINSRSTEHPEYPLYNPIIPRHDANHDITTSEVPQDVITELNATKFKFGATSDFTMTLSGGVLTVPAGDDNTKLLQGVIAMALVNRWYGTNELATFEALGGLFTGARAYCCTINGVNYEISNANLIGRTITLASYPANGSYTVTFHPHRIAGYTDRARLRKLSGEAPVVAGDFDGLYAVGGTALDGFQGHRQAPLTGPNLLEGNGTIFGQTGGNNFGTRSPTTGDPVTDTVNGVPRTGKTTKTRAHAVAAYTHLRSLLATSWTSA